MAITAQAMTWIGQGPTDTLQVLLQGNLEGNFASTLIGKATFTGDGATTTAVVNYIDGTKQLSFNPSGVIAYVIGGNDTAGAIAAKCVDAGDTGGSKTATVTFSAAPANAKTVTVLFVVLR